MTPSCWPPLQLAAAAAGRRRCCPPLLLAASAAGRRCSWPPLQLAAAAAHETAAQAPPWADAGLNGGAFFELPGCVNTYAVGGTCGRRAHASWHGEGGDHGRHFVTGLGRAVANVLIENVRLNDLSEQAAQSAFWSAMTPDDTAHRNITFRKVVSMRTMRDGINVHGHVVGWLGEDLHFERCGDDVYAVWGAGGGADVDQTGFDKPCAPSRRESCGPHSGGFPPPLDQPPTPLDQMAAARPWLLLLPSTPLYPMAAARSEARRPISRCADVKCGLTNRPATDIVYRRVFAKPGGSWSSCSHVFGAGRVAFEDMLCCNTPQQAYQYPALTIDSTFCPSYANANVSFKGLRWFDDGHKDLCAPGAGGTTPVRAQAGGATGWSASALHTEELGCEQ